ncbi:MAG: 16S rRNA (adenine(1518)-N(6)/adenine(1519)-N(6))-dimethyltransferase RsmA [Acidimicrobiia bacterium]|nr:16S rRNA (adenine(1518)-N(6)/adenine(1519)-N(6))-dimethyltransferase RsmA [Acidimicrobiia bacterium]
MNPQTRTEVRALLDRHGLRPAKHLGQHFLVDPNITRKIVTLAGVDEGDAVVEIGAGTGTLTLALASAGAKVVTYEIDRALEPLLNEVLAGADVDVRYADAADEDLAVALDPAVTWFMVANLPYNVGTSLVLDALRHVPQLARFVVMVQTEVAERLVARPGSAAYGLPSVVVGIHGQARLEFKVPPQVFLPPPNVGSAVVRIDRRDAPAHAERAIHLAAAGFGRRRKMLRSSLADVFDDPTTWLVEARIAPTARAEELAPEGWLRLAEVAP